MTIDRELAYKLLHAGSLVRECEDLLIRVKELAALDGMEKAQHHARRLVQRAEYLHDSSKALLAMIEEGVPVDPTGPVSTLEKMRRDLDKLGDRLAAVKTTPESPPPPPITARDLQVRISDPKGWDGRRKYQLLHLPTNLWAESPRFDDAVTELQKLVDRVHVEADER